MAYPTVVYSDSTISGFPTQLLGAVVLNTYIQIANKLLSTKTNSAASDEQDIELTNAEIASYKALISGLETQYEKALKANL